MNNDSFVINIRIEDFYKDIASDVENGLTHLTMIMIVIDLCPWV